MSGYDGEAEFSLSRLLAKGDNEPLTEAEVRAYWWLLTSLSRLLPALAGC